MSTSSSSYAQYEIRKRSPNPRTSALLVIDMQNRFSSMILPIVPAVNTTISLCRAAGIPVIYTLHVDYNPDYTMIEEWWANHSPPAGPTDSQFIPGVDVGDGELVLKKNTYSVFRGTGLEEKLREMGVEEVIVTGTKTNVCCETSAREAFVRGFRVFFSTDATATENKDLHETALKNAAYGFGYLVDCKRLETSFSKEN